MKKSETSKRQSSKKPLKKGKMSKVAKDLTVKPEDLKNIKGGVRPAPYGSDREIKTGFEEVDVYEVLSAVSTIPISRWSYKEDPDVRHIGPMAQDFRKAFGTADDRHIHMVDAAGVALASIQALFNNVQEQRLTIEALRKELDELKNR